MPKFSKRSLDNLATCHPALQKVAHEAIKHYDFVVIQGSRGRAAQMTALREGKSKAAFGQSPHNFKVSLAFDAVPYPGFFGAPFSEFKKMAEAMTQAAKTVGVDIVWGADWNGNGRTDDERFIDGPHFELKAWRTIRGELAS